MNLLYALFVYCLISRITAQDTRAYEQTDADTQTKFAFFERIILQQTSQTYQLQRRQTESEETFQQQMAASEEKLQQQEEKLQQNIQRVAESEEKLQQLNQSLVDSVQQNIRLRQRVADSEEQITQLQQRLTQTEENEPEPSGFTATTDFTRTYTMDDKLIFDQIVSNVGNDYLANTSEYVCPRRGLYLFSLSVVNYGGHYARAHLVREDMVLATVRSDATDNNQGAVTAVIECERGGRVWVKSFSNSKLWGSSILKWNIFSGVLLQYY